MSTIRADNIADRTASISKATGDILRGAARAWLILIGTGTISFPSSFNVSSLVDDGVGLYTVNFTNAMPGSNYAAIVGQAMGAGGVAMAGVNVLSTGSMQIRANGAAGAAIDNTLYVAVFSA